MVDDISCNAEDQAVVNASSSNEIIDMNVAEIDSEYRLKSGKRDSGRLEPSRKSCESADADGGISA